MSDEKEKAPPADDMIQQTEVQTITKGAISNVLEDESGTLRYDHSKAQTWINKISRETMEHLVKLRKPYKYIVNVLVMKHTGAGMHVCSSTFFGQNDGCYCQSQSAENSDIYCVVTVHWVAI